MSASAGPVLCLNAGSSSLKFAVWHIDASQEKQLVRGAAEGIGQDHGRVWVENEQGEKIRDHQRAVEDHRQALEALSDSFEAIGARLGSAGHRIVHGGPRHRAHTLVTEQVRQALEEARPLAPLHLPPALAVLDTVRELWPALPQAACFDTAFHRDMPEVAQRFPLPSEFFERGILRYGFHGLSYEWAAAALQPLPPRTIVAHLGNGASLAAIKDGRPWDTTMGLTPSGGLMMGTRTGDLDPGVLLYLLREEAYDESKLSTLIDHRSGLEGVSGYSSDMKTLTADYSQNPSAAMAVDLFCRTAAKHIGALSATLDGLDLLAFTAGIGENSPVIRQNICDRLRHLGIVLDPSRNQKNHPTITSDHSTVAVKIVKAEEERMIARHTRRLTSAR